VFRRRLLDAAVALRRALTELNQMLPTVLRGPQERAAQLLPEFRDVIDWWETATLEAQPYLLPRVGSAPRRIADFPRYQSDDLLADVQHCVALADARGMDLLVCDLTRPDIGLSVARVFVPPLRHFWRRLGPGRLYDVPVEMGRLERGAHEDEMNPISMFV
jgi:ribosomal protein S12 methylthiotransferase accessory factor